MSEGIIIPHAFISGAKMNNKTNGVTLTIDIFPDSSGLICGMAALTMFQKNVEVTLKEIDE